MLVNGRGVAARLISSVGRRGAGRHFGCSLVFISLKFMKHDPRSDLNNLVAQTLIFNFRVPNEEAQRVAAQVGEFLVVEDVGGKHFELLNVTLQWNALCGSILDSKLILSGNRFAGLPLIGVLRWFGAMRNNNVSQLPSFRGSIDVDHIEAAVCMALRKQETEAQSYSPDDTYEALFKRANAILSEGGFDSIEIQRFREAMNRLRQLQCLTSRTGSYRLKDEVRFQIPEE
jgi:hypothetical protein